MQSINAYYLRRENIFNVAISSKISWIMRKIIKSRDLLDETRGWGRVSQNGKFSIKKAYRLLEGSFEHVNWRRLILNNKC